MLAGVRSTYSERASSMTRALFKDGSAAKSKNVPQLKLFWPGGWGVGGGMMLENGTHAIIAEIAAAEKINESYVDLVLRLALQAPDLVEAILSGRQPAAMTLATLMKPFPVDWKEQRVAFLAEL